MHCQYIAREIPGLCTCNVVVTVLRVIIIYDYTSIIFNVLIWMWPGIGCVKLNFREMHQAIIHQLHLWEYS